MKRLILTALVLVIALPAANAQEKSPFRVYLDERTPENFVAAFEAYKAQMADTTDYGAAVYLAYMSLIELEKNLGILEEGMPGLKNRSMFSYGNILLELDRYDEAIAVYDRLNEKSPKWSCPWRHKGEAYWKMGEMEKAVEATKKAIETRETHYDAYVQLAGVYRDMEKYELALQTLEKGLTYYGKDIEDPQKEIADSDVGYLHLELLGACGRDTEYKEKLEQLRKLFPEDERFE